MTTQFVIVRYMINVEFIKMGFFSGVLTHDVAGPEW